MKVGTTLDLKKRPKAEWWKDLVKQFASIWCAAVRILFSLPLK